MLQPDGTYEEWLSFERRGSISRWHHVVWDSRKAAERGAAKIMFDDHTICCLHHSPTAPLSERPESAFGQVLEAVA